MALVKELKSMQRLLSGQEQNTRLDALPTGSSSDSEGEDSQARTARRTHNVQLTRLRQEEDKLRQQLRQREEECERLRAAAAREREDTTHVTERLQAQLAHERREVGVLGFSGA